MNVGSKARQAVGWWQPGHCPQPHAASNAELCSVPQVHEDTRAAELGRARARGQVKRCGRCSSPATLGVYRLGGAPPAKSPLLCLQCSELRSELEALSEEYQSCLTRLRQCRDELNRSHGSQAQVGTPVPTPALHSGLGKIPPSFVRCREMDDIFARAEMRSVIPQHIPSNTCFSWQRQRGHWIPLLVAVVAVAIATFLASYRL